MLASPSNADAPNHKVMYHIGHEGKQKTSCRVYHATRNLVQRATLGERQSVEWAHLPARR